MCDDFFGESLLDDDIIDHSGIICSAKKNGVDTSRLIRVYVEWDQTIVEIALPDETSAFRLRDDCGSYSQHRWSMLENSTEVMQLVVKHNSCLKALFMQPLCMNCRHRNVWRQHCKNPKDVFYLLQISDDVHLCDKLLEPLIHKRVYLSTDSVQTYEMSKPCSKPLARAKAVNPKSREHMRKLHESIERGVLKSKQWRGDDDDDDDLSLFLEDASDLLLTSGNQTVESGGKHLQPHMSGMGLGTGTTDQVSTDDTSDQVSTGTTAPLGTGIHLDQGGGKTVTKAVGKCDNYVEDRPEIKFTKHSSSQSLSHSCIRKGKDKRATWCFVHVNFRKV